MANGRLEFHAPRVIAKEGQISGEAGGMSEQIPNRHRFTVGPSPFRQPRPHGVLETQHAIIDSMHRQRRRGDDLGERRKIVDRAVGRFWSARLVRERAERSPPEGAFHPSDFDRRGGERAIADALQENLGGASKSLRHQHAAAARATAQVQIRPLSRRR